MDTQVYTSTAAGTSAAMHNTGALPHNYQNSNRALPQPPLYARQDVIHGLGIALIIGGAVGLAATVAAALWLVGTPIFVISSVSVLAIVSLAMVITGIVLRLKREFWQDPAYRYQVASEIVEAVQRENLGFKQLQVRFERAMEENIFSDAELNDLYSMDIRQLSYIDFIQRHGENFLSKLTPQHREGMRAKFIALVTSSQHGIQELTRRYAQTIALLEISSEDLINHALFQQMDDLQSRDLTYKQFLQNNGREAIEGFIRINQAVLNPIRESFLNMGWQDMTATSFSQDRLFLGIEESDIEAIVRRDCRESYFTFKQKHSIAPLLQAVIAKEELQSNWQEELVTFLDGQSAATILAHSADLNLFDLSSHALLFHKWQRTPISEIFSRDRVEFTTLYLATAEGRANAIWRILQEADTSHWLIQQLLQFHELWGRGLLTPATCFEDGSTIQERFDSEIETIGSFEQLVETYRSIAFEHKLCCSPAVQKLVWQMHRAHPLEDLDPRAAQMLQHFPFAMPERLHRLVQDGKRQLIAAKASFEEISARLEHDLKQQLATRANSLRERKAAITAHLQPKEQQCHQLRLDGQALRSSKSSREARLTCLQNQLFLVEQRRYTHSQAHRPSQTNSSCAVAQLRVLEANLESSLSEHATLASAKVQGLAAAISHGRRVDAAKQNIEQLRMEIQKLKLSGNEKLVPQQLKPAFAPLPSAAETNALHNQIDATKRSLLLASDQLKALDAKLAAEESIFHAELSHHLQMANSAHQQACEAAKSAYQIALRDAKDGYTRAERQIRENFVHALDRLQG